MEQNKRNISSKTSIEKFRFSLCKVSNTKFMLNEGKMNGKDFYFFITLLIYVCMLMLFILTTIIFSKKERKN